jgi:hypothetical protein
MIRKEQATNKQAVSFIKKSHALEKEHVIERQLKKPIGQLIEDFIIEMDAKNKAYYFILENGLFERFKDYCKNNN